MDAQEFRSLQEAYEAVYENQQLDEGMTMKDFKQQRSRQKQKEKRAADKIAPIAERIFILIDILLREQQDIVLM